MGALRSAIWEIEPYVPGLSVAEVRAAHLGLERIVKLGSNESAARPPAAVLEAIADAAAPNRYPDPGAVELRHALAELHGVEAAQIVPGNGADELIRFVCQVTLEPGRSVVYPWPGFPTYGQGAAAAGAASIAVATDPGELEPEALSASIRASTTLVCLPNPNNPTGALASADSVVALADALPPHVVLMLDEAYHEYTDPALRFDGTTLVRAGYDNICVLRTFSKAYGLAALRIGYAVASPRVADALNRVRTIFNVSAPAQCAALAALGCRDEVERAAADVAARRVDLAATLKAHDLIPYPSQGNFVYAEPTSREPADAERLADALLERGVIVRRMQGFGAPAGIRVTLGTPAEMEVFAEQLAAVSP